jgi:hypothetical protein
MRVNNPELSHSLQHRCGEDVTGFFRRQWMLGTGSSKHRLCDVVKVTS